MATKMILKLPSLSTLFVSGFTQEEKEKIDPNFKQINPDADDWEGHLVTIVNGRWLLDSTFDFADDAVGGILKLPKVCHVFPLPEPAPEKFHLEVDMILDDSELAANVQYIATEDRTWQNTEAWNDSHLPRIENFILTEVMCAFSSQG
jgi:hypothetical protein